MDIRYRELTVDNLFDACSVLDAIGTEQMLSAFNQTEIAAMSASGKDNRGIGVVVAMKICGIVIKYIPAAKNEICAFIAGCIEWENGTAVTVDEIRSMNAITFIRIIRDFFKQDGITDFFKELAALVGLGQESSQSSYTAGTVTPLVTSTLQ